MIFLVSAGVTFLKNSDFICDETATSQLTYLDISRNKIEIEKDTFLPLTEIETLHSSDQVLCCMYRLHHSLAKADCFAPDDELSSCTDLLNSMALRAFLWLQASASLFGNIVVMIYRLVSWTLLQAITIISLRWKLLLIWAFEEYYQIRVQI